MNRKQKLVLAGFLGFTFLFGCSQVDDSEVSASLPSGFELVSETKIAMYTYALELKSTSTNCHYIYVDGDKDGGLVQMFIEKDGQNVPYCE